MTQDAAHRGFVLLNIPFVHVCVERHSRSRTTAVHSRKWSCAMQNNYTFFQFYIANVVSFYNQGKSIWAGVYKNLCTVGCCIMQRRGFIRPSEMMETLLNGALDYENFDSRAQTIPNLD